MTRKDRIIALLSHKLETQDIELIDDSAKHAGHAGAAVGGQTHYTLIIQSKLFSQMSKIKRHQCIYSLLTEEFKGGLHALSIQAFAPDERAG